MTVFAFIPNATTPGFMVSSGNATAWSAMCPPAFIQKLKEAHAKNELVLTMSAGLDNDWFLRTTSRVAWNVPSDPNLSGNAACAATLMSVDISELEWITFMPDSSGFIAKAGKKYAMNSVPASLEKEMRQITINGGLYSLSVGKDGGWVAVTNKGVVYWSKITDDLKATLQEFANGDIAYVQLSLVNADLYFVQLVNGNIRYRAPVAWHASIKEHMSQSALTTPWNQFRYNPLLFDDGALLGCSLWISVVPPPPNVPVVPPPPTVELLTLEQAKLSYDRRWKVLLSGSGKGAPSLTFKDIPWPILLAYPHPDESNTGLKTEDITAESVTAFLLSQSVPWTEKERKEVLRDAMLHFHPDKFDSRIIGRVYEDDRDRVKDTTGVVARILNDLMKV